MKKTVRIVLWTIFAGVAATFVTWGFFYQPYERAQELMPGANGILTTLYMSNDLPVIIFFASLIVAWIFIRMTDLMQWNLSLLEKSVVVIVTIAAGGYICGMLTGFPRTIRSMMDEHVIYDGACSVSSGERTSTAQEHDSLTFHCTDSTGDHVFFMSSSELTGSDYIARHPGVKTHCTISLTEARCDISTVRPSDP